MIIPHPILSSKFSEEQILSIADRVGYDGYIPTIFVKHLAYAFSFTLVNEPIDNCIQEENPYTEAFRRVLSLINVDEVKTNHVLEFAFNVLLLIRTKVNFRDLELSSKTSTNFEISEDEEYHNYAFDLKSLSSKQRSVFDIPDEVGDEFELPKDVIEILKLYHGIALLALDSEKSYNVVKQTIKSFNDFSKVRRYKFALPTFTVDLGMKKLDITKIDTNTKFVSEMHLAIDWSYSMSKVKLSKPFIKAILLHYLGFMERYDTVKINLIKIVGCVHSIKVFESADELQEFICNLPPFLLPTKFSDVLKELNQVCPGKAVVLATDGTLELNYSTILNHTLYTISLNANEDLKRISLLSGGQFITI